MKTRPQGPRLSVPRPPWLTTLVGVVLCAAACVRTRDLPPCDDSPELPRAPKDPAAAIVVAAGDIADCPNGHQSETAAIVDRVAPDAVLTLGDTVYPNASLDEFVDCYDPSWGRFRSITRAAVGNHEYHSPHGAPFFAYFCGGSGPPFEGRTSFSIGAWHVIILNSNCGGDVDTPSSTPDEFGGCGADSPQGRWLKKDLAAHPSHCTIATWHHPRFNSDHRGTSSAMGGEWGILHDAGAEVVLTGHAHFYERLAPMDAEGRLDAARGIREFVVGTGGAGLHAISQVASASEAHHDASHGVLKLELRPNGYAWRFLSVNGAFTDEGEAPCHD